MIIVFRFKMFMRPVILKQLMIKAVAVIDDNNVI